MLQKNVHCLFSILHALINVTYLNLIVKSNPLIFTSVLFIRWVISVRVLLFFAFYTVLKTGLYWLILNPAFNAW